MIFSYNSIQMKKILLSSIIIIFLTSSCGIYKRSDIKDNPVGVNERVERNIKEGRGVRFGKLGKGAGGTFDFASSNELWRASMNVLDFISFTNASYSGGILITDWFSGDNQNSGELRELKITVKFLSNEIRADGIAIIIHERICPTENKNNCQINKIQSGLENEIKLAILKEATLLKRNQGKENAENFKRKLTINKEGN